MPESNTTSELSIRDLNISDDVVLEEVSKYAEFIQNIDYAHLLMLCVQYSLRLVVSLLIFFIGKWVISKLSILLEKVVSRAKIDEMLAHFVVNAIKTLLFIFVILAALSNLGIETTSFVAVIGALGLAIGMSFKDTFGNVGAGVLIIFFRPFKLGDAIDINGATGRVRDINLFSTYVLTADNRTIIVPNSQVIGSRIVNLSLQPYRRVDLVFGIDYGDDIRKARDIILKIANKNELVLKGDEAPAKPFVGVLELADSSVNLAARFWVKTDDYWDAYFSLIESVKIAFDESGISIPFPQVVSHFVPTQTSENTEAPKPLPYSADANGVKNFKNSNKK